MTRPVQRAVTRAMHLAEVEVTEPIQPIMLAPGTTALALFVRRHGRPIAFFFKQQLQDPTISVDTLRGWITEETAPKLVAEAVREELAVPAGDAPLPALSVAICTRNRVGTLARCLESLRPLQLKYGFELLVVDNAPPNEETGALVRTIPGVRYALEKRPGLDFARNRACEEATGELLAFLDDDVVVDACWYDGLLEAWRENPDAGGFTGLVMPLKMDTAARVLFELRSGFRRGFEKIRFGRERSRNRLYPCGAGIFGAGCNMVFRRDLLLRINGFDEALDTGAPLPGGGDLDIFYRVVRSGFPMVYEPALLVFHEHRADEAGLRRQYHSWGLGFMAFVQKSRGTDPELEPRFRQLIRWWFLDQFKQLLASLRGRHVLPPNMILAEIRGGIVGFCGGYQRSVKRVAAIRKEVA